MAVAVAVIEGSVAVDDVLCLEDENRRALRHLLLLADDLHRGDEEGRPLELRKDIGSVETMTNHYIDGDDPRQVEGGDGEGEDVLHGEELVATHRRIPRRDPLPLRRTSHRVQGWSVLTMMGY